MPLEPPLNWTPGPRLFPSNVIAGYNTDYDKYDASTWAEHVLNQGKTFADCTPISSCSGEIHTHPPFAKKKKLHPRRDEVNNDEPGLLFIYLAIKSGTPRVCCWPGYVFRGGPTTPDDYQRDVDGVEDSMAFTIS